MEKQNDLYEGVEDQLLTTRLFSVIGKEIQGMSRSSEGYVNNPHVAAKLIGKVGVRNVIEFCVTTLERKRANEKG